MAGDPKRKAGNRDVRKSRKPESKNPANPLSRLLNWIARGGEKQPPCPT
jgi:hypothetical protein